MKWIQFVKVWEGENELAPYYIQWAVWCWRKPVWVGLPLVFLAFPLMVVDAIYGVIVLIMIWSKHK